MHDETGSRHVIRKARRRVQGTVTLVARSDNKVDTEVTNSRLLKFHSLSLLQQHPREVSGCQLKEALENSDE